MKSSVFNLAIISSLLGLLVACQPIQGNSLLTDQKTDSSAHIINKDPKSEELYLKAHSPTVQATGLDKVEVSGECYVSTYPTHAIIVLEGGIQLDIVDLNPTTDVASKEARCKNGRFNISINSGVLAGGVHSLRFLLQAKDQDNKPVINEVQGVSMVTLTK